VLINDWEEAICAVRGLQRRVQNQEDHELWLVGSLAEINEHMAGT
jgi:hypothetical protein